MTPDPGDPLQIAGRVAATLERLGLRYSIGGSLASSVAGEPRATLDIDLVVEFDESSVHAMVEAFTDEFYVDDQALARAARTHSSANAIHLATSLKVDFFAAGGTAMDLELLGRRVVVTVATDPPITLFMHTPEDILLQKLLWFRRGGHVSDRQWRDVLGIVRVQGPRLDRDYLTHGAERLAVTDLLGRAFAEGGV